MESVASMLKAKRTFSILFAIAVVVLIVGDELISPVLSQHLRRQSSSARVQTEAIQMHVPATLDLQSQRQLSLNLGGGNCKWQPPVYDVPEEIDFYKTVIAGYPSGDKRMIFVQVSLIQVRLVDNLIHSFSHLLDSLQMEALTGWPAKDEWDFEHLGMSNHPFIKANYPHHEGIWGWGDAADQVVMMVRNIRRSMVSAALV